MLSESAGDEVLVWGASGRRREIAASIRPEHGASVGSGQPRAQAASAGPDRRLGQCWAPTTCCTLGITDIRVPAQPELVPAAAAPLTSPQTAVKGALTTEPMLAELPYDCGAVHVKPGPAARPSGSNFASLLGPAVRAASRLPRRGECRQVHRWEELGPASRRAPRPEDTQDDSDGAIHQAPRCLLSAESSEDGSRVQGPW